MFIIFGGNCFYARGGGNDILGMDANREVAIDKAKAMEDRFAVTRFGEWCDKGDEHTKHKIEWVHVFDMHNIEIIYESKRFPHGACPTLAII